MYPKDQTLFRKYYQEAVFTFILPTKPQNETVVHNLIKMLCADEYRPIFQNPKTAFQQQQIIHTVKHDSHD